MLIRQVRTGSFMITTFNEKRSTHFLRYFVILFQCIFGVGLIVILLIHFGDWSHLPERLLKLSVVAALFAVVLQIRDSGEGFNGIQVSAQGLTILNRSQGRQSHYFIEWNAIKEVRQKHVYPKWLHITEISLSCMKEGMSQASGLPRVFPSGWVSIPFPWPVENPEELTAAILQNAPKDNLLIDFILNQPDSE